MWKLRVFVENSEKLIMYPKGVKEAVIGFFENISYYEEGRSKMPR